MPNSDFSLSGPRWVGNYESEALKFLEEESLCMGSCPALCGKHASWGSKTSGVPVLPFPGSRLETQLFTCQPGEALPLTP